MEIGQKIKELRESKGWSQDELAARVGISQPALFKIENGQTIKSRFLPDLAKVLEFPLDALTSPAPLVSRRIGFVPPPEFFGERDLPVYAAAEGGPGEMVVSTDPIDMVPRPWYLGMVKEGYAVLVTGDSMDPAFRPGEIAIVNPRLSPQPSTDVILVGGEHEGEFKASIKFLIKSEPTRWYVRQFNPPEGEPRDFWRDKREWPKAYRVVGKYSGM
jgi:transcriptional regulator with XRE-family HTH domain